MKCFISKNYRHLVSAGDKAKTDIEKIMLDSGYRNIGLKQRRVKNSVGAYFITLASILKGMLSLKRGDTLVVQYPLKKYYDFVVSQANRRGAKVITVIHDLGSFRRRKLTVEEEIARLNRSAALVVHSPAMRDWLAQHGVSVPMTVLGLFDYLSPSKIPLRTSLPAKRPAVMFAGDVSPEQNGWIYGLADANRDIDLVLYGGGFSRERGLPNMKEMGYVSSNELISTAQGDYGVVWYGGSLDEGSGPLGEYLRYNAPHKTSLYLRSGLPVIIWDKAALAEEVAELGVGVCVDSLRNLDAVLAEITPERYVAMRENAVAVAKMLSTGEFIKRALDAACRSIDGSSENK